MPAYNGGSITKPRVASAVLEGLLAEYPKLQQHYGYEGAERET